MRHILTLSTNSDPGTAGRRALVRPWRPNGLSRRDLHPRGARAPRAAFHEPRPARVRPGEPAGDGEGRAVLALLALPRHPAAAFFGRVRGIVARVTGDVRGR